MCDAEPALRRESNTVSALGRALQRPSSRVDAARRGALTFDPRSVILEVSCDGPCERNRRRPSRQTLDVSPRSAAEPTWRFQKHVCLRTTSAQTPQPSCMIPFAKQASRARVCANQRPTAGNAPRVVRVWFPTEPVSGVRPRHAEGPIVRGETHPSHECCRGRMVGNQNRTRRRAAVTRSN